MEVQFREIDPFNCWIWLRTPDPLGQGELGYLETAFDSWFFLGKLGAFNAENLQTHEQEGVELSWMAYDPEAAERAMPALMHNMGPLERQGCWARCWVDLGTSDAFGLDVLINTLRQISQEVVEIEQLLIGGVNEDWPIEEQSEAMFAGLDDLDDEDHDLDHDDD